MVISLHEYALLNLCLHWVVDRLSPVQIVKKVSHLRCIQQVVQGCVLVPLTALQGILQLLIAVYAFHVHRGKFLFEGTQSLLNLATLLIGVSVTLSAATAASASTESEYARDLVPDVLHCFLIIQP
jgi:hypothetical protein